MENKILKKIVSVFTCFAVVVAMMPGVTFKSEAASTYNYVAIGDMTTSGFGLSGYDDNTEGFVNKAKGAYPSVVANNKNYDLTVLAGGAMRPDDLDAILNPKHKDDAYTTDNFTGANKLFVKWANQIDGVSVKTADDAEKALRTYYTDSIKNADLITYNLGAVSLGKFITYALTEDSYSKADIETLLKNLGMTTDEISDLNISKLKDETRKLVRNELKKEGITVTDETKADTLADRSVYAALSFVNYFDKNIAKIRELNPDCDIIVVGINNFLDGVEFEYDGKEVDVEELLGELIDKINTCMESVSTYSDEYYFVDINNNKTKIKLQKDNISDFKKTISDTPYLNNMITDVVKDVLAEDTDPDYNALAPYADGVVKGAWDLYNANNYTKLGNVIKKADVLKTDKAAQLLLGWGVKEDELLELGYLYKNGKDNAFVERFKAIINNPSCSGDGINGVRTGLGISDTTEDFMDLLDNPKYNTTNVTGDEVRASLNKCANTVEKFNRLGKVRQLLLDCIKTIDKMDLKILMDGYDEEAINDELEDIINGKQDSISASTQNLVNMYFQFVFPDSNAIALQPSSAGHNTIGAAITTAINKKTKATNEVASSNLSSKYSASKYLSLGDSVATGYGVDAANNYTSVIGSFFKIEPVNYGLEGARVSDLLYLLGGNASKDAYTDTLNAKTATEYQNQVKQSDFITLGIGLDSLSRYILWAKDQTSYNPDFSRFEDDDFDSDDIDTITTYAKTVLGYIGDDFNESGYTDAQIERMAKAFAYAKLSLEEDYTKILDRIHSLNSSAKVVAIGLYNAAEGAYFQDGEKYVAELGKLCDVVNAEINEEICEYAAKNSSWCGYANIYNVNTRMILNDDGSTVSYNIHDKKYIDFVTAKDSLKVHPSERGHVYIANAVLKCMKQEPVCNHPGLENAKVAAIASTTSEEGSIAYYCCSECGACFKDAKGQTPIDKEDTVTPKKATIKTASLYEKPNQIKVTWGAVSDAAKYVVTATPASGTATTATVTGTTATLKSLTAGVKYTIKVQAVNALGNKGTASATKTVYTIKKMAAPKAAKSSSKVKISWSKVTGVTGYQISQSTSKTGTTVKATITKQATVSKTIAATKGKTYYYKVRAYTTVDGKKIYGQWSAVKAFKRS